MIEEVEEREHQAEAQVKSKQQALEKAGIDTELQRLSAAMTELQAKASALRQVNHCRARVHLAAPQCFILADVNHGNADIGVSVFK
jgi:hypothetical protein